MAPRRRFSAQRLADFMYGPMGYGPGQDAYFFGPEYSSKFDKIPGWRPELATPLDPTREVGYFRFNTGNPERDALMSIFANEFGLDNYVRAVQMLQPGGDGWFKSGKGVGALGHLGMSAAELSGVAPISRVARGAFRAAPRLLNAPKAVAEVARRFGGAARAARGSIQAGPRPVSFAVGPGGASTTVGKAPSARQRAVQIAVDANQGARPRRTLPPVSPVAKQPLKTRIFHSPGFDPAAQGRALSIMDAARTSVQRGGLATTAGTIAFGANRGAPLATAAQAREAERGVTPQSALGYWERNPLDALAPQTTPATPPPGTPPPVSPTQPSQPTGGPDEELRVNVNAIKGQYDNLVRDLRGMYNRAETDREKEQLRMILADVEAQKDAGLIALRDGYASTSSAIRSQGTAAREAGMMRGQEVGERLGGVASDLEQRLIDQQAMSAMDNRGLGVGAAVGDPMNEWVGLLNTLAPLQQSYTEGYGNLAGEGLDWLASTVDAQGLAQQADLQRLAAATRSGASISHQRRVDDRIQRDLEAERQALMSIMMSSIGAQQSAGQFNASLARSDRDSLLREQERSEAMAQAEKETIYSLARNEGYVPSQIESYIGRPLTPQETQIANNARRSWMAEKVQTQPIPGQGSL